MCAGSNPAGGTRHTASKNHALSWADADMRERESVSLTPALSRCLSWFACEERVTLRPLRARCLWVPSGLPQRLRYRPGRPAPPAHAATSYPHADCRSPAQSGGRLQLPAPAVTVCTDGSASHSTGHGTCSWNGGISPWRGAPFARPRVATRSTFRNCGTVGDLSLFPSHSSPNIFWMRT